MRVRDAEIPKQRIGKRHYESFRKRVSSGGPKTQIHTHVTSVERHSIGNIEATGISPSSSTRRMVSTNDEKLVIVLHGGCVPCTVLRHCRRLKKLHVVHSVLMRHHKEIGTLINAH